MQVRSLSLHSMQVRSLCLHSMQVRQVTVLTQYAGHYAHTVCKSGHYAYIVCKSGHYAFTVCKSGHYVHHLKKQKHLFWIQYKISRFHHTPHPSMQVTMFKSMQVRSLCLHSMQVRQVTVLTQYAGHYAHTVRKSGHYAYIVCKSGHYAFTVCKSGHYVHHLKKQKNLFWIQYKISRFHHPPHPTPSLNLSFFSSDLTNHRSSSRKDSSLNNATSLLFFFPFPDSIPEVPTISSLIIIHICYNGLVDSPDYKCSVVATDWTAQIIQSCDTVSV